MVDHEELDIDCILWSNEAVFKLNRCINRHNCVYWAPENPKVAIDAPVNLTDVCVWCAVTSEWILGPFFFDGTVTAQSYLAMLQHQLLPLLQQQDEAEGLYFQQDRAPAHYATLGRDSLDANLLGL